MAYESTSADRPHLCGAPPVFAGAIAQDPLHRLPGRIRSGRPARQRLRPALRRGADLPQEAFKVFEDDKPQEITFFSGADVPSPSASSRQQRLDDRAEHMVIAGGTGLRRVEPSGGRAVHDSFQRERAVRPAADGAVHQQRPAAAFGARRRTARAEDGAVRRGDRRTRAPGIGHAPEARARRAL